MSIDDQLNKVKKDEWILKVEVVEKISEETTVKSTLEYHYEGPINESRDDGKVPEDTMAMLLKQMRNSIDDQMKHYIKNNKNW